MSNADYLQTLKKSRAQERKLIKEAKKSISKFNEEIDNVEWEAIREAAETRDIAITGGIAKRILQGWSPIFEQLTDDEKGELQEYVNLCQDYNEINNRIQGFYITSDCFKSICRMLSEGQKTPMPMRGRIKPRLTQGEYRRKWASRW